MPDYMLKALFTLVGLLLLWELFALLRRLKRRSARFAVNSLAGLCTLLLSNTVGTLFGMGIGLNALTLPVCAGLGLPGVALLWALRYIL